MGQFGCIPVDQIAIPADGGILLADGHIAGADVVSDFLEGPVAENFARAVGDGGALAEIDFCPLRERLVPVVQVTPLQHNITIPKVERTRVSAIKYRDVEFVAGQLQRGLFTLCILAHELHHGAVLGPQQAARRCMKAVFAFQRQCQRPGRRGLHTDGRPGTGTARGLVSCNIHIVQRQCQVLGAVLGHGDDIDTGIGRACHHQLTIRRVLPGHGGSLGHSDPHTRHAVRVGDHGPQGNVEGHDFGERLRRRGLRHLRHSPALFALRRQRCAARQAYDHTER